jgi:hypothetical protein
MMTEVDKDALRRAIKMTRALGAAENEQIDRRMAEGQSFEEIGRSCAYGCQRHNLRLKPWESPPIYAELHPDQPGATELLEKLLAAGLSRWEPDPIAALEAHEARSRNTRRTPAEPV